MNAHHAGCCAAGLAAVVAANSRLVSWLLLPLLPLLLLLLLTLFCSCCCNARLVHPHNVGFCETPIGGRVIRNNMSHQTHVSCIAKLGAPKTSVLVHNRALLPLLTYTLQLYDCIASICFVGAASKQLCMALL
jgi:hypothetical protein